MPQQATIDLSAGDKPPVDLSAGDQPPSTSESQQPSAMSELVNMGKAGLSLVYSRMLDADPRFVYQNHDEIDKGLSEFGDFKQRMGKAATVKDDPLYMLMKHTGPEPFESQDKLENFVHDISEFAGDPVVWGPALLGTLLGGPVGARIGTTGGFALDQGLRKALADHYQKGTATSMGDLASRTAATLWAATKGGITGEVMGLAGKVPVPKAFSDIAANTLRGLYQSTAMTTVGSLLDARVPKLEDFERNAIAVAGLGLITHAATDIAAKQGLLDVYTKDGTTPQESAIKLTAQPPVKQAPPEGLRPAIRLTAKDGSTQVITGEPGETHAELAQRVTGVRPTSIEELDADPKLADKVLSQPEVQDQSVIDRAMEITGEASLSAGDENAYFKRPTEPPKSGRGFASSDGQYMNRKQSQKWVKENQPDVHDMWSQITGNDKAEFHSQDYKEASDRVAGRTVLEGEDSYSSMSPDNAERIAAFRSDLNDERLQESPNKYGETLRSFITGQRDMRTTVASNLRLEIRKALPDEVDREALTFMRDFKSDPKALQERLAAINNRDAGALGITDTEHQEEILDRLQKTAPAIKKALNPTPKMQAMDAELTKYATSTLEEARGLGILDSTIPPEQYITHILREADEEAGGAKLPRPKLSRSTPYAQERKYLTTLDAMVANKVPRTLDAADAIAVYGDRHATAAATRMFVTELKNSELGKWGTSKDVPSDWRKLGEGRVFEYVGVDKDGNNFSTSFYAPKDIVDAIKPITERKTIFQGPVAQKFRRFQSYIKSADMALSVFHMKALTISAMNNMSYSNFVRSMQTSINTPEFGRMAEGWAADGLVTTRSRISSDVYEGLTALPSKASIADSVVGIKQAKEAARAITHATFDVMQTRYKVTDAASKDAAWMAKHPEASEQEHFAARRAIAKEVNAVYGGLNWENMGLGANQVELMRAFILAPDWTISNLANLKYTLEGGAGGKAARMFWFKSISTGLALTQLTSLAITGQTSKNLTQVYLGNDKDGKEMYSSWFFAGAPKDLATWINSVGNNGGLTGTALFITNKLAPLAGIPPRLIMNKDWSGRPITKPKQGALEKTGRQAAFAAQQVLPAPFALKDAAQMLMDPDKDYTKWDFINTIAGSTTIHEGDNKKTQGSSRSRKGFHLAGAR